MLNVSRETKNGVLHIRLSGNLDASANLSALIGELPEQVVIVCSGISQINPSGAKAWIDFFSRASAAKIRVLFTECPPPVVEQLNYLTQFSCGGTVASVSIPFVCENCCEEIRGVVKADALRKASYRLPSVRCSRCSAKASFSNSPEEYFAFLIRQNAA